jgi:hypothetical protein
VLVLLAADITGVRVVPARAGADGVRRRGIRWRSVFPRLVVETAGDRYVFEVAFGAAKRAAARIRTMAGHRA